MNVSDAMVNTAAVTDATVTVFSQLSSDQQAALLDDLFTTSTNDGVNFNLLRHTIASSDLSSDVYTYDDASSADSSLSKFSLTSAGTDMVNWIKQFAAKSGQLKLLGSSWSPPGWMKANGVVIGNANNNNLNLDYASSFAQYFVKYLQAFADGGVTVDAVTIQNEPLNSNGGYPTMYVDATDAANVIQNYVGPALRNASLNTEIWAYDHNTGKFHMTVVLANTHIFQKISQATLRQSLMVLVPMSAMLHGTAMRQIMIGVS